MQNDFYENVISNRNSPHRYWGIYNSDGIHAHLVGVGGITNIQHENSIGEISLIIDPKETGNGFGENAAGLLFDQAFNYIGLQTVFGECYLCNSAHVFWEKTRNKYDGYSVILPNRKFWNGDYYNSLYFSIDKEKFNENR